jgi:hypothetical protein
MTDRHADLFRSLAAFGADFSRWPTGRDAGAREALLSDPAFRRAWEAERDLDRLLSTHRDEMDTAVAGSGAAGRVGRNTLARLPSAAFAKMHWHRIAAAMLVAGMLGGVMDMVLARQAGEPAEFAGIDPLFTLDDSALQ